MDKDFWKNYWPNFLGGLSYTALWWLVTFQLTPSGGASIKAIDVAIIFLVFVFGAVFFLVLQRNLSVLAAGGDAVGTREREAYDALRARLAIGGLAAKVYADWLEMALAKVDLFFGDADYKDRTLFPNAFGLQKPAPLWTAPAYDRCLLLAFLYPIITIFMTWAIANHLGVAEQALQLPDQPEAWKRIVVIVAVLFLMGTAYKCQRAERGSTAETTWLFAHGCALLTVLLCVGVTVGIIFFTITNVLSLVFVARAEGFLNRGGVGILAVTFALICPVFLATAGLAARIVVGTLGFVFLYMLLISRKIFIVARGEGMFLGTYSVVLSVLFLIAAHHFGSCVEWPLMGPQLLFLGLLSLINTPFDWFCIGLTRALLRRGLERGGWSPYVYACIDACLTVAVVVLLALAIILGIQAFDEIAAHGGAKTPFVSLDELLSGIAAEPSDPKNWWVYALLLSTFIPSLTNLAIAGCALMRGFPGIAQLLLRFMPEGQAVSAIDRSWIAWVLTGQMLVGVSLGIAAQVLLVYLIFQCIVPFLGLQLFDLTGEFVAFDIPAKFGAALRH